MLDSLCSPAGSVTTRTRTHTSSGCEGAMACKLSAEAGVNQMFKSHANVRRANCSQCMRCVYSDCLFVLVILQLGKRSSVCGDLLLSHPSLNIFLLPFSFLPPQATISNASSSCSLTTHISRLACFALLRTSASWTLIMFHETH